MSEADKETALNTEAAQVDKGTKRADSKESPVSQLIELSKRAQLFCTRSGSVFATIEVNGHLENWSIDSQGFRSWLTGQYYKATDRGPTAQAIADALNTITARAQTEGCKNEVFIRVAKYDGAIYLDLVNDEWQAVEVTAAGWKVVSDPPVKFTRATGMASLPVPVPDGNIDELRKFVNVANDDDFKLLVAWTLAAFNYDKPYPVLILGGEQGCAKSTTTRILRRLIDPNDALLKRPPSDERNLAIMAQTNFIVALDNLSNVHKISNALCCLSTGGAFATRKLYTDGEEVIFQCKRPLILNGIGDVATASDLLDRSIALTLPTIEDSTRLTEDEIEAEFSEVQPRILGALLNVVAQGLRNLPTTPKVRTVRMADFATWIAACEPALGWQPESFVNAYTANRNDSKQLAVEVSSIAEPLRSIAKAKISWTGSLNELLHMLNACVQDSITKSPDWPKTPEKLSSELRRLAPNLRIDGIEIRKLDNRVGGSGKRLWLVEDRSKAVTVVPVKSDSSQAIDELAPFDDD